jgi:GAF domain-containing protein/HAMP domain-containing protein
MAFSVLFIFTVVIATVTLAGLNRTQTAYEDAIAQGIEIRRLSDQLDKSLLQARESEGNFLRYWREQGFDTAYKNYVVPHTQNVADMREDLKQLSDFAPVVGTLFTGNTTQMQYEADIAALTQNVDVYDSIFNALVEAHRKKGFDDSTDFESQFRIAAQNMDSGLFYGQVGIEQVKVSFFRLRISEKNYVATASPAYAVEINTLLPLLEEQIKATDNLDPDAKAELLEQANIYQTAFDALVALDQQITNYNKDLLNSSTTVEELTAKIRSLGEEVAAKDIDTARSNSAQTFTISIVTVLVVLAVSILLAITLSQQLTRPILSLTKTAREISAGKFDIQAQVNSADEIGMLAQTFNSMTGQLQGALQTLDRRAKELEQRTIQLELTSQQSDKRAQQLQTIAEIARNISAEKNLNKLLPEITKTVSERFGFYHVGIFLLDDNRKYAVLLASNSPGGQEMLRRQHRLEVGQVGIVGNVTSTGKPRIALDTGADAIYFNNPDLPLTRSEVALPLKFEEQVIGALDIQSTDVNAFSDEDINVLTTLSDQVSLAIQNVRLFNQIEKSLVESNAIQRQYVRETWRSLPKLEKLSGFRYTLTGAVPLIDETKFAASEDLKDKKEIRVPIILRGETIGTLSVHVPISEHTSADQVDLIKAVAERVALSAENARLFEDTTRRAVRESLVSDITTKIRSHNDPQSMIETAINELRNALGATKVEVIPQAIQGAENKKA